ncbi:hypothetical protein EDC04DRAFT_2905505 [Pisolithus marmoratus]|nr:hypothetical protein EDC04DRAFT_2905505 [Pisolithus marmoratus]
MFPGVFDRKPETAWSATLMLLKDISQTEAKESICLLIRPALQRMAPQSPDGRLLTQEDLADFLLKEFRKESRNGELDAVITLGRITVEFILPEHLQHHSVLIDLTSLLSEQFNKGEAKEDLDDIIILK